MRMFKRARLGHLRGTSFRTGVILAAVTIIATATASVAVGGSAADPSADGTYLSPEKQAALLLEQDSSGVIAEGTKPDPTPPQYQAPDPPGHAGEIRTPEDGDGTPFPFPAVAYHITSWWLDLQDDTYISIYAGSLGDDSSVGVLVIDETDAQTGDEVSGSGEFQAPNAQGPLTLTAVEGNTVDFSDASGATGTFDVSTDTFSQN
jgi:hypothetical protein